MRTSLIVAVSDNNVIGKNNTLPWHLPADLAYFKKTTSGKPVIMGRLTYESIGRPLPNRLNIVISTTNPSLPEGVLVFSSIQEAMSHLNTINTEEAFIIGGNRLFADAVNHIDNMYITRVHATVDGDVFFPEVDMHNWKLVSSEKHEVDEKNKIEYTFELYQRLI